MRKDYEATINRSEILISFVPLLQACNAPTDIVTIISKCRKREYVYARTIISLCLRDHGFSFSKIGYVINRDHAAVIHLLDNPERFGKTALNHKAIQAFRNPTIMAGVTEAVIAHHQGRIHYHQEIINKLQS